MWCDAGLQSAHNVEGVVVPLGQVVVSGYLSGVEEGKPVVGPEKVVGAMKAFRGDANDGKGMLVELDGLAEHIGAGVELPVPEVVTQYDEGR